MSIRRKQDQRQSAIALRIARRDQIIAELLEIQRKHPNWTMSHCYDLWDSRQS